MSRPPRFLVSGYYGFGNAGDEAILAGLVEGFRELRPDAELTVLSGNPAQTMAEHGVPAVGRGLRSVRRNLPLCDALIIGGGGLLQDATSWRSPLYYLAVMWLAHARRRPVACIGQSIGPLKRSWVRALVRRELRRATGMAVRDELSQRLLLDLGVSRPAQLTADLAFLLPAPTDREIAAARAKAGLAGVSDPLAAIALRPRPGAVGYEDVVRLGFAIGKACQALGLRPVLMPLQPSQDIALAGAVAGLLPSGSSAIATGLQAREILALVASCQMVIAMRLHALIFAALCGVPLVAISYDPKVDAFMSQLDLAPALDLRRPDDGRLSQAIQDAWREKDSLSRMLADRLPRFRSLALRNIEIALSVLPDV